MWNVIAGVTLGALTGLLLGLSASPVVGTVLGALITGVLVFLSLNESAATSAPLDNAKLVRLSAFSCAAIAALLLGVAARSSSWLGPSEIQHRYSELLEIGLSPEKAQAALIQSAVSPSPETERVRSSAIWSGTSKECDELKPDRFEDASSLINAYEAAGEPWQDMARGVMELPAGHQIRIITLMYKSRCNR